MGSVAFFLYFGYMGYGRESGVQSIGQTSKVKIIESDKSQKCEENLILVRNEKRNIIIVVGP